MKVTLLGIGNEGGTVGIKGQMEVEGEIFRIEGEMENDGQVVGVESEMENDGQAAEGVGIQPKGAYVPQFTEHIDCNIEVEWEAFLDRHQEDIWNSWEDRLGMNNEEDPRPTQEPQPTTEFEEHEMQTKEFEEVIVDSDFEYEEEPIPT
ncbi:Uncharacterized protein Adt_04336 [Abeliophyllum distichum]|uniref:Uncharacterized protein n=1 Tax=Abeliophyllum distichum TaxID=126358 RepID=A0ABD1W118_9LAMI